MNKTEHKNGDYTIQVHDEPYEVIHEFQLTEDEREEFDYIDWDKVDEGWESASFIRIDGELYDLMEWGALSDPLRRIMADCMGPGAYSIRTDSYFSGYVLRFPVDEDNPVSRDGDINYDCEQCYVATVMC